MRRRTPQKLQKKVQTTVELTLKSTSVGSALILYRDARPGYLSASSLTQVMAPRSDFETTVSTLLIIRQGPHLHAVQDVQSRILRTKQRADCGCGDQDYFQ